MTDPYELPFDTPPSSPSRPSRRVLTVSQLTAGIRVLLESTYPDVWVEGEISNARVWKTGHLYFTLKDGSAQLKAVMFRSALRHLRFKPTDGQQVVARGRVGVYEPKGEYQIVCEYLEPHGVGALQLAFDQLRERLETAGFAVGRLTFFNTLLFPPILLVRLLMRPLLLRKVQNGRSDFGFPLPFGLNGLLHRMFAAEASWLVHRNLPVGVSLLVLARPEPVPEPGR